MKKNLILVATAAVLMASFTACGDDKGTENNPSDPTNTNKPQLVNGDFEDWTTYKKGIYDVHLPAISKDDADAYFWDTANDGITIMTSNNNITQSSSDVRPGTTGTKSARMESKYISILGISKFAAGNIYSGKFGSVNANEGGATVYFGRPFTARPQALKGWYKATVGNVTHAQTNPADIEVGDKDQAIIYIALSSKETQYQVNTWDESTFIDFTGDDILAYKELVITDSADWTSFELPLTYASTKTPKQIIVVATSSRYGDYFTGSTASVLQVDDFELVY